MNLFTYKWFKFIILYSRIVLHCMWTEWSHIHSGWEDCETWTPCDMSNDKCQGYCWKWRYEERNFIDLFYLTSALQTMKIAWILNQDLTSTVLSEIPVDSYKWRTDWNIYVYMVLQNKWQEILLTCWNIVNMETQRNKKGIYSSWLGSSDIIHRDGDEKHGSLGWGGLLFGQIV